MLQALKHLFHLQQILLLHSFSLVPLIESFKRVAFEMITKGEEHSLRTYSSELGSRNVRPADFKIVVCITITNYPRFPVIMHRTGT